MPSCNTHRFTWVSLTLGVGYLFMAAPAKCSRSLLLTLDKGYLLTAAPFDLQHGIAPLGPPAPGQPLLLGCGVGPPGRRPWPWAWGWSSRPQPLASDLGSSSLPFLHRCSLAFLAAAPHLGRGVIPLESQIIDAFDLWCWRRLLRFLWTAMRSNQSILKKINPEYSLEGLMLRLKLQYFGHLLQRTDSLEKTLMLGKTEGRRRRGQQRMRWLYGI